MRGGVAADHHHLSQRVRGGPGRDADPHFLIGIGQDVDGKAVVELLGVVGNVHAPIVHRTHRVGRVHDVEGEYVHEARGGRKRKLPAPSVMRALVGGGVVPLLQLAPHVLEFLTHSHGERMVVTQDALAADEELFVQGDGLVCAASLSV